jgi:type II secretory pathway component GspD/PulD (secretin)
VDGTFIRVFPRRVETRRFDVNYLATSRSVRRALGSAGAVAPSAADRAPGGASVQVAASDGADLFVELADGVRTLLSPNGRFNLDRKAGLLQVTDYPDPLEQVQLYLEAVEQRVSRQVAIQAWVVDVELDEAHAGGLDWDAMIGNAVTVTRASVPALLAALRAQGRVTVIASPRVVAMNNEPAVMRVAREDAYFVTPPRADPANDGEKPGATVARAVTEGLVLSVTPQITTDGFVQLSVMPSVTERDGTVTSRPGGAIPAVSVREADTHVRLRDGETLVIAGLMRQRDGAKTDLVVLLTPTIVAPAAGPESSDQQARIDEVSGPAPGVIGR